MKAPEDEPAAAREAAFPVPRSAAAVLVICAVLLLVLGVTPGLLDVAGSFF
jgi:hypothetical protein